MYDLGKMLTQLRLYLRFGLLRNAPPYAENNVIQLGADAEDFRQKCFASNPDERPPATELRRHPYLTLHSDWVFIGFK